MHALPKIHTDTHYKLGLKLFPNYGSHRQPRDFQDNFLFSTWLVFAKNPLESCIASTGRARREQAGQVQTSLQG